MTEREGAGWMEKEGRRGRREGREGGREGGSALLIPSFNETQLLEDLWN